MKKIILVLITTLLLTGFTYAPGKKGSEPRLDSVAGVVIDQDSGRILYSKNGDRVLAMASTTKIITALVAIERGNLKEEVVVSKKAASVNGSTAKLSSGERVSLEELLYGLMLRSGNDAAIAIAEHIGGSVEGFVRMMNEKALELGALNTSFETPHGLDADEHFTTAEDLARITAHAMKNEFFAKLVATTEISSGVSGSFNRSYSNINKFLHQVEGADGVKTGYTGKAGKCLVASVKHEHGRYICVVLNSGDRWDDAAALVNYANEHYKFEKVLDKGKELKRLRVYGGNERYVEGIIDSDLFFPIRRDKPEEFKMEVYAPSTLFSPVKNGDIIGNIVVTVNDKVEAKYPILSDREVKRKNFINIIKQMFSM